MPEKVHAGLAGFLETRGLAIESHRLDGAVVINADRDYRIYCRPAPHGDLVFESRLLQLPEVPADASEIIQQCLHASWVRMSSHADVPVISDDGVHVLLHQRLPSDATVDEVERSLERFVNAVADWRRVFRIL